MATIVNQKAFRGRNDDGNQANATWIAALNEQWVALFGEPFRVRVLLAEEGGTAVNQAYKWEYRAGFGTFTSATIPSPMTSARAPEFSPDGQLLVAYVNGGTPSLGLWSTSDGGATLTRETDPTGAHLYPRCLRWDYTSTYLIIGIYEENTYFQLWKRSGNSISRITFNPTWPGQQSSTGQEARWWQDYITFDRVAPGPGPRFHWGKRTGDSISLLPNPVEDDQPLHAGHCLWTVDGNYILFRGPQNVTMYARSGDTISLYGRFTLPSTTTGQGRISDFTADGKYLVQGGQGTIHPANFWAYAIDPTEPFKFRHSIGQVEGVSIDYGRWEPVSNMLLFTVAGAYLSSYLLDTEKRLIRLLNRVYLDPALVGTSVPGAAWHPSGDYLVLTPHNAVMRYAKHGAWVDVGTQASTDKEVRFVDSANVTDKESTTQQIGSGSFIAGQMNESNPTNAINLSANHETELEAVLELVEGQAMPGVPYVFRVVRSADSKLDRFERTPLGRSLRMRFAQSDVRLRNDDGSEIAATWIADANEPALDVPKGSNFRARVVVGSKEAVRHPHKVIWQYSKDQGALVNLSTNQSDVQHQYAWWDRTGRFLACASATVPYHRFYSRDGDVITPITSDIGTFTTSPRGVHWHPSGEVVAFGCSNGVQLVQFSPDKGRPVSRLEYLTTSFNELRSVAFSPDGTIFAGARTSGLPGLVLRRILANGPDYKLYTGVTIDVNPDYWGNWVHFSDDGLYLALAVLTAPGINWYERDGLAFTKLPNPAVAADGNASCCHWHPSSKYLAMVAAGWVNWYRVDQDVTPILTKLPTPAATSGGSLTCQWDPTGRFLAVVGTTAPCFDLYEKVGETLVKISTSASAGSDGRGAAWTPCGEYLAVTASVGEPRMRLIKNGTWYPVDEQAGTTQDIRFASSLNVSHNDPTTQQISSGTFRAGVVCTANPSALVSLAAGELTEYEGVFEVNSLKGSGETLYSLRAVEDK